jgi:hypothetical protein
MLVKALSGGEGSATSDVSPSGKTNVHSSFWVNNLERSFVFAWDFEIN